MREKRREIERERKIDTIVLPPSGHVQYWLTNFYFLLFRYEDEINKRTECENDFVLIKKVCLHPLTLTQHSISVTY